MAYYNVISTFVFFIAFILNRKGFHNLSTLLVAIEIVVHATLATHFIGWESGFFYYLIAIITLVFHNPSISNLQKIALAIMVSLIYISLKHYSNINPPATDLNEILINNMYFMNSFFLLFIISSLTYFFSYASEISENRIEEARHEADMANQSKSLFLANMSHELRTPLNAIIGYSEMLKEEAQDNGLGTNTKDLDKITKAGNHLLTLINSVLDLSKIEAGKIEFEYQQVNINDLIQDTLETFSPLLQKTNNKLIKVIDKDLEDICIDTIKLKQSLLNLLSNASKFTDNGKIELNIFQSTEKGIRWTYFIVSDNGIGIDEEKFEKLFKPFSQASTSTTRLYGGTGLGLTISKHFITRMDGSLEVTSKVGEGSTFTIKLPQNSSKCKDILTN